MDPTPTITVRKHTQDTLQFETEGFDTAMVNALRRILLAEVPTAAIEKVEIYANSSIMYDEMLAHRLGLVPVSMEAADQIGCFVLHVKADPDKLITPVFTRDLKWESDWTSPPLRPQEIDLDNLDQSDPYSDEDMYDEDEKMGRESPDLDPSSPDPFFPKPLSPDILISKLKKGQEIHLKAWCSKGRGKDHSKWSPVSTAAYDILSDPSPHSTGPRRYLFTLESVGQYAPSELIDTALKVLEGKCHDILQCV